MQSVPGGNRADPLSGRLREQRFREVAAEQPCHLALRNVLETGLQEQKTVALVRRLRVSAGAVQRPAQAPRIRLERVRALARIEKDLGKGRARIDAKDRSVSGEVVPRILVGRRFECRCLV